jgi:hypothetical protein
MQGCTGNAGAVVVFDEQQVVIGARQQTPQLAGTLLGQRRAGGVLRASGDDQRAHAAPERPGDVGNQRPVVVHPHRLNRKSQCGNKIQQVSPARILDRHAVAGAQMRGERPLDAVECPAGHREMSSRNTVGGQRRTGVVD